MKVRKRVERYSDILLTLWDPAGVNGVPQARDEYDTYANRIVGMLAAGATAEAIAAYLLRTEREELGLSGDVQRAERTASAIIAAFTAQ